MKQFKLLFIISVLLCFISIQSFAYTYSGGSGTSGDPYQIATLANLIELSTTTDDWASGKYFIQTAHIDASSTSTLNAGEGFVPIGSSTTQFRGSYNGQNHTITNLYINRSSTDNIGLFGLTNGATISNIGVVSCNITGNYNVGGLVGFNFSSTISNSYSSSNITRSSGTGTNYGGFCGRNNTSIQKCYSIGKVYSSAGTIWNEGNNKDKGFVGYNNGGTYTNNFFDSEASEQTDDCENGTTAAAKTTSVMKKQSTFTNWDFTPTPHDWKIESGSYISYPYI